jgi:glycosyltransferase involved in cell wall biosynthesis
VTLGKRPILSTLLRIRFSQTCQDYKIVISSASQLVVLPAFFIFTRRPYLDAGWSLYESTKVNKTRSGFLKRNLLKTYLIDLVATIISKRIFLESELQKDWYCSKFLVRKRKTAVIYTGLDESDFLPDATHHDLEEDVFRVIFRGKNNDEAGLNILCEATKELEKEKIQFIVLSKIDDTKYDFSKKTVFIQSYFPSKSSIASYLASADLSLGQLSNHERLKRTIPHKAYESAFLGVPYLSARNPGVLEIFKENENIFCFNPGSSKDLAEKILFLSKNKEILRKSSINLKNLYAATLSQKVLTEKFLFELDK